MNQTLAQRQKKLQEFFPDLRNNLTEGEIEEMEEIRLAMERRAKIPQSEMHQVSPELLDRMQSETEASALMPDESREWLRKILRGEKLD